MRLAHVVVRRDPNAGTWWWVCLDPECRIDEGLATQIADHRSAVLSADAHARTSQLRTPPVEEDSVPLPLAGAPGGVRPEVAS